MAQAIIYKSGLDIGSTTAKMVLLNPDGSLVFSDYQRHHARINQTIICFLEQILDRDSNCCLDLKFTGSAALNASVKFDLPFVQEVIATHRVVKHRYPEVRTAMDIGGEDSKMIFFDPDRPPDTRMNGSCAGGTGSFIDQMASLLGITPFQLNELATCSEHIYPVASRCGVFAKTDVQNMLSRNVPHPDIAASVFHAVAVQCINSLARGKQIKPNVLLCGGVFSFLPELVKQFLKVLDLSKTDIVIPERSELVPAIGAALYDIHQPGVISAKQLLLRLKKDLETTEPVKDRMKPLFESESHFKTWEKESGPVQVKTGSLKEYSGQDCFLGIDSGSTTTKIVVLSRKKELLFSWYNNNSGNPIKTVIKGLSVFKHELDQADINIKIARTAVTGYGEDLIRTAFDIDDPIVETLAHKEAASFIDSKVTFILDIGGQDMKAMFIKNGQIRRIEVNEACSSGCGSFLETFSNALNYNIRDFAHMACLAKVPCDLGTRCTVFMNSKIKQSLRENASVGDISAGLAYSVIKNCLFKVLKLHDMSQMGDHIVLQGGAFKNASIVRAMEILTRCSVKTSTMPELMGAFGAALTARDNYLINTQDNTRFSGLDNLEEIENYKTSWVCCKGCENTCRVTQFNFSNGKAFYSGNKCEKYFTSKGKDREKGFDFIAFKNELIFNSIRHSKKEPRMPLGMTIGIPRVLNFYENFPFWQALFNHCGIRVKLSSLSTHGLSERGMGTVMSDNICFPAKLVHGHIYDLADQSVDRIFYPIVMYEQKEYEKALNTFNCPIVSSYADVIESAIHPEKKFGIPLDRPVINFNDRKLLKKACYQYLKQFNIKKAIVYKGVDAGFKARDCVKQKIQDQAQKIIINAKIDNKLLIVLASRPYHTDGLVNHKLPSILTDLGADIVTEDGLPIVEDALDNVRVITQWSYPNRIYNAARWVAKQPDNIQMVQVNSFGCGPDAVVIDETREILNAGRKNHTLIKVDEISSPGSVRLRLRSMVESLKQSQKKNGSTEKLRKPFVRFEKKDMRRTIWAPFFAEDYSHFLPPIFKNAGYDFTILPKPDRASVDLGLRYANNDICYPGTLVIGDIVKALKTRTYRADDIAIGITQTGGQCRASNYLSLIRKAMIKAGFDDIPIISVTASQGLVDQPGFNINWLMKAKILFVTTMYADCIAKMYYATAPRERVKGTAQQLRQHYIQSIGPSIVASNYSNIFRMLAQAIRDFNEISVHKKEVPKMGIVGEIYAKYNYFANQNVIHWLIDQGIEPVIPPIIDYFIQDLVNYKENIKAHIRRRKMTDFLGGHLERKLGRYHRQIDTLFSKFRFAIPFDDIKEVAIKASDILTMTNQFGEGWLVPGEIAMFAVRNIHNAVSLQPFGCIANHIVSKGVEKRIKDLYPKMNLHYLDFDAGMSEANVLNRLHLMIERL